MRVNPVLFGVFVLTIFVGTIWGFQSAGIWSVSGKVTGDGQAVQPSVDDVETIKGWMTLEQISKVYQVTLADILAQFNLPADIPASTAIKDLESDTFSAESLREWLQNRSQVLEPVQEIILTQEPTPTQILADLEPTPTPLVTEHLAPERTITGKTTFQELRGWGVSENAIQQVIGGDLPALSVIIKDYVTQQGKPFSEVKAALQVEVDKLK